MNTKCQTLIDQSLIDHFAKLSFLAHLCANKAIKGYFSTMTFLLQLGLRDSVETPMELTKSTTLGTVGHVWGQRK